MPTAPPLRQPPAGRPAWLCILAVTVGVVLLSGGGARGQTNKDDLASTVTKLNKKALDEYENLNFEEARKILKDALDFCREAGLDQHPVTARTNVHLGVVVLTGFKQRDAAAKYFRKALEIQPDIKMTKSLANPEIQAAFDEVVASMTRPPPGGVVARTGGDAGISHEPVTRASQGRGIPISVTLDPSLSADQVALSFRGAGSAEFSSKEMVEATPGNFIAEIPATATTGTQVAYLIEAQKKGQPIASRGTKASPLIVSLAPASPVAGGIQRPAGKQPPATTPSREGARFYLGLALGTGVGWATGSSETNGMHVADPAGLAAAQLVHLAPEFGYFLNPALILSVQARIQFLSGLTSQGQSCVGCSAPPSTAFAGFAKLTWLFGTSSLKPYLSASLGAGRIRHAAEFPQFPTCGSDGMTTCVDSIPAGVILLGPGGGVAYALTPGFGIVAGVTSQVGFPQFTFNLDFNVGLATQF